MPSHGTIPTAAAARRRWAKRTLTVLIGFPVVITLVLRDAPCVAMMFAIGVACHYEYLVHLCPRIHAAVTRTRHAAPGVTQATAAAGSGAAGSDGTAPASTTDWPEGTAMQLGLGALMMATALSNSRVASDYCAAFAVMVTCFHHVLSYAGKEPPSPASLALLLLHMFGLVYIPWNMCRGLLVRLLPDGWALMAWYMLCVWNGDNGAILIGRWLGRRRLFKAVSPNKTWAGVLAQFATASLTSVGVGVAARAYGLDAEVPHFGLSLWGFALVGLVASVLGMFGDLLESVLKRAAGVKDSGNLIPGHGGALDRMDGLIPGIVVVQLWCNSMYTNTQA